MGCGNAPAKQAHTNWLLANILDDLAFLDGDLFAHAREIVGKGLTTVVNGQGVWSSGVWSPSLDGSFLLMSPSETPKQAVFRVVPTGIVMKSSATNLVRAHMALISRCALGSL